MESSELVPNVCEGTGKIPTDLSDPWSGLNGLMDSPKAKILLFGMEQYHFK